MRRRRIRRRRRRSTPRRRRFTWWKRFSGGRRITRRRGKVGQGRRRGKRGDAEGEEEKREEKELKNFCRNLTVPAALELSASGRKLNQWDEGGKVLCPLVKSPVLVMQLRCEIILNKFKLENYFQFPGAVENEQEAKR